MQDFLEAFLNWGIMREASPILWQGLRATLLLSLLVVPLGLFGGVILAVLSTLPRLPDNPYVIVGKVAGQNITDLQYPWRRIRGLASLDDVRIHDLRHTYASNAVSSGMPIQMVGRLLGHTQLQTTMRYAHVLDDDLRQALDGYSVTPSPKKPPKHRASH
jgi:integrase